MDFRSHLFFLGNSRKINGLLRERESKKPITKLIPFDPFAF